MMATAILSRPRGHAASPCFQSHLHSDSTSAHDNITAGWIWALAKQQIIAGAEMEKAHDSRPRSKRDEIRFLVSPAHKAGSTIVPCHNLTPTGSGLESVKTIKSNGKPSHARLTKLLTSWTTGREVAKHTPQGGCMGTDAGSPSTEVANSAVRLTEHSHTSASADKNGRGQKRTKEQSGDDESGSLSSFKRRREGHEGRLSFACPFFKKDPVRWRSCHKHELRKISYVKQHLYRTHPVQPHCPVCGEVFEADQIEERLNRHLRLRECEPKTFEPPQGITWRQREQLGRRVPAKLSEEDQWFLVFDIVFPGHPRPSTPYVDPDMSEDLSSYLDFAAAQGSKVLRKSFLRHVKSFPEGSLDETALDSLFRQGLDDLRIQWFSTRSSPPGPLRSPRFPISRPQDEQPAPVLTSTIEHRIRRWASLDCFLSNNGGLDQTSSHTDSTGHSPDSPESPEKS